MRLALAQALLTLGGAASICASDSELGQRGESLNSAGTHVETDEVALLLANNAAPEAMNLEPFSRMHRFFGVACSCGCAERFGGLPRRFLYRSGSFVAFERGRWR